MRNDECRVIFGDSRHLLSLRDGNRCSDLNVLHFEVLGALVAQQERNLQATKDGWKLLSGCNAGVGTSLTSARN
jgi:hypothetical protein